MGDQPPRPDPAGYPQLSRDLAELVDAGIDVPRELDDILLEAAGRALRPPRARALGLRYGLAAGAAAAVVALVVWLAGPPGPAADTPPAVAADLDRNGRVDILDAFALARQLKSGEAGRRADMNADGVVNGADVEAIAMLAVALPEGAS